MNADAFVFIVVAFAFLLLFYGPWQWICCDFARQLVFEQRDAIFDLAADKRIFFNSPEYKSARSSLNTLIRFSHKLTITYFVWMIIFDKTENSLGKKSELTVVVEKTKDPQLKAELNEMVQTARRAVIIWTMLRSIIFWILLPFFVVFFICSFVVKRLDIIVNEISFRIGEAIQVEAERSVVYVNPKNVRH